MSRNNKKAFTLIELLVVIAIIAILAAILFPVFAQAKLAAKKTTSLSNVKELGLGLIMYGADYDDRFGNSEYGSGDATNSRIYDNWANDVFPYIKSGKSHVEKGFPGGINNGGEDLFHDPGAPNVSESDTGNAAANPNSPNPTYQWGFGYGVNENIMVHNDYSDNATFVSGGQVSTSVTNTEIPQVADSILLMTKGVQNTSVPSGNDQAAWTYPYFVTVQSQYIGNITATPATPGGTPITDGDDSASTPGGVTLADGFTGSSNFDTDCSQASCHGMWENVGHPRYRYAGAGVACYADGHAKSVKKGSLKWYKNIFVANGGIVQDGYGSWCAKGAACSWGGAAYAVAPY